MTALLDGARLKLKRANKHIGDLESLIADFGNSDKHRIVRKKTYSGGEQVVLESMGPPPIEINLIAGDAVHNLRAALDHAMVALVMHLDSTAKIGEIKFPMPDSFKSLETALQDAVVSKAFSTPIGNKIARVLLDEVKFYGGLDHPIRFINKLDNIDKHRLLITTVTFGGIRFDGKIGGMNFSGFFVRNELGKNSVLIKSGTKLDGNLKPTFDVFINEANLPPDKPLVPSLTEGAHLISEAFTALDKCFI